VALVLPFTFVDGTLADGVQVNSNFTYLAQQIEGVSAAAAGNDVYQAGTVASTDWKPGEGKIVAGTGELSFTTFGGAAWLPGPVSGLVRTFTTAGTVEKLKPPVLPGPGGYINVGVELTASGSAATVSVVSGAEQTTAGKAVENPAPVSSGKLRVRNVIVLNTAGSYSINKEVDRRPWAMGAIPNPTFVAHADSPVFAQPGDFIVDSFGTAGVVNLPATPPINAMIGVYAITTSTRIVVEGTPRIYGDFVSAAIEIFLMQYQHVILRFDGTNWYIIAGEPKREQKYEAFVERVAGTEYEPSATRPVFVSVFAQVKGGNNIGITVGGVEMAGPGPVEGASKADQSITFICPPGQKWKSSVTGVEILKSSYLTL